MNRGLRFRRISSVHRRGWLARALILAGTSVGGLVGGHLLSYALFAPDAGHRRALLHQTGHGYLPRAVVLAIVLSVLAASVAARIGFRRGRAAVRAPQGMVATALRLCVLQTSGFVSLEVVERLASGSTLGDLAGPLLAVGLAAQVAVAWLAAALLALIGKTAEEVARALGSRPEVRPAPIVPASSCGQLGPRRSDARPGAPVRGPPPLLPQYA